MKTLFLWLTLLGLGSVGFAPFTETSDLTGAVTPAGDEAQDPVLTVEKSARVMIFAYDSDNFNSPVLAGVKYSGYDRLLIRIVGNRVCALGSGTTRVTAEWNGYTCDFVVVAQAD